jgi:type IV pilus assembly protein PilW
MNHSPTSPRRLVHGLSLVELMIAMLLGLLVAGAATTIFMSNRQTYQATDNLGRIQENLRTSFELMARDVREAGGNPCANDLPIANVLNNPGGEWWSNFGTGLIGYEAGTAAQGLTTGTAEGQRVAGTDAIELKSAVDSNIRVVVKMPEPSADIEVSSTAGLDNNDIIMICDFNQASIMQVTQTPAGLKVQHNSGAGAPGNCTKHLGFPVVCTNGTGNSPYLYDQNAIIAAYQAMQWYIGNNVRGGRSLYRRVMRSGAAGPQVGVEEIAEGVTDMQLEYLTRTSGVYNSADMITDWPAVVSVRITLVLEGQDNVATDGGRIDRTLTHIVAVRNRTS